MYLGRGAAKLVDVTERFFMRVDVTEEFPLLAFLPPSPPIVGTGQGASSMADTLHL